MLRLIVSAVLTFAVVTAIGTGLTYGQSSSEAVLSQRIHDAHAQAVTAYQNRMTQFDAAAGLGTAAPPPNLDGQPDEARRGLLVWFWRSMAAALVCAVGMLFVASAHSSKAAGPEGQRRALPAWFIGLVGFLLLAAIAAVVSLRLEAVSALVATGVITSTLALTFGLGLIGYWVATAMGVQLVMRPSVPLASLIRRG